MSLRGPGRALLALGLLTAASPTRAAPPPSEVATDPPTATAAQHEAASPGNALRKNLDVRQRPTGIAELGVSLLSLPGATVCVEPISGCNTGDYSPVLEAWQLYAPLRHLAFGAGFTLGLTSTANPPRRDPAGFEREHDRRYFSLEVTARTTLLDAEPLTLWIGGTTGLAVVSDSFSSKRIGGDDPALVGPRADTIRTEGFALSLALGVDYALTSRWRVGGFLRPGSWFFSADPDTNRVGDQGSLRGRVSVLSFGATVGYAVPL